MKMLGINITPDISCRLIFTKSLTMSRMKGKEMYKLIHHLTIRILTGPEEDESVSR